MSVKLTNNDIIEKLQKANLSIKFIGNYISYRIKCLFKCLNCGHEWNDRARRVINGSGCPKCRKSFKSTFEEVNKRLEDSNRTIYIKLF